MTFRKLAGWAMALGCTVGHAQATMELHPPIPQLPGDRTSDHFHLGREHPSHSPQWATNLGQSVVRAVALKHRMTSGPLVQYGSPDRHCGFDREDPSCA